MPVSSHAPRAACAIAARSSPNARDLLRGTEVRERDRLAALAPERRDEALEARAVRLDQAVEVERPRSRGLREAHRPAAHGDGHEALAQADEPAVASPRRDLLGPPSAGSVVRRGRCPVRILDGPGILSRAAEELSELLRAVDASRSGPGPCHDAVPC